MPNYAKFMKDILSNKKKLEEHETVMLTEECSSILQKKLSPKINDPGKRWDWEKPRPPLYHYNWLTNQLNILGGVIEDVLVKVDKFIFPADFIILDMEEDHDIPIILGRPFLATGRALIDVQKG
ncbi:uncharacterized protein LOC111400304 [Olea europaea var. sylvestris]|uniref:uncharacterized protein LOC111400304 n=1 Tax=Olea europaea var. sylvestris TaxID=158386 RepID=UPI000C1D0807|nr:uncharacterized protein LOC111400304 [Olea europaea var. sylvestris]